MQKDYPALLDYAFLMKQALEMKVLSRREARQSTEAMTDPVKITAVGNCERQVF